MEDIDPPREMAGADKLILSTLEQHGLHWDGAVLYQSTRHARYREVLDDLLARGQIYRCACTRARLISLHRVYDGYCRQHPPPADAACALRLQLPEKSVVFDDRIQGVQVQHLAEAGDCIIHRKDGLFAYQLAVVVDDIDQGVTDIVRGNDILPSTGAQIHLTQLLGGTTPRYAHVPVLLGADGHKLSKQSFAPALDNSRAASNLCRVLALLGQKPPLDLANELPETVLQWAVTHWDITQIARVLPAHDTQ
jgi:glutamyl-Q tRNA(Asp) synthetase